MPKRLIDGEALWRSTKLRKVPIEFRAEYANLIPLAEADGTFEADPRMVWSNIYSYNREDVTVDLVEEILDAFENAGMILRKTDEKGKIWGKLVGIEARLPAESQRDKYKPGKAHLFKEVTEHLDAVQSESTEGIDRSYVGLVRFGVGLDSNSNGRVPPVAVENLSASPTFQEGLYPNKNPKRLHKFIVEAWQRVKGQSAVAKYPSRYPQKWEEHCENHSGDLIVPAFELWAREEGIYNQSEYPVTEYLRVAAKYLARIMPVKQYEKPDPYAADKARDDADIARSNAEHNTKKEKEKELLALGAGFIS